MKVKVNGRAKGKGAERELCKILSTHLGGSFMRVPSSGAMVGGSNKHRLANMSNTQGRAFKGDIIPPDHLPNLYVEVKSYKEFRFHQLLQPEGCIQLNSWIQQCLEGTEPTDNWMICFKISQKGWFVALPYNSGYKLDNHVQYTSYNGSIVITEMTSWLKTNSVWILKACG
jgi:Holliday junction resolvase